MSDPAFRRRLQPASAAPVPRTGKLTIPDCLCMRLSVQVSVHVSVFLLVPPSELWLVPLHTQTASSPFLTFLDVTCHMRLDLSVGGATRKSATWNAKPSGRRPKQVDATSLNSSVSTLETLLLLA